MLWAIFSHFRAILLCTQLQVLLSQHAILDSIDGDPCTLKNLEKMKEIFKNSGNTLLKYDIVWITFGQKPFYRSKCPSCFGRLPLEIVRWGTIGSNGSLAVAASLLHHF